MFARVRGKSYLRVVQLSPAYFPLFCLSFFILFFNVFITSLTALTSFSMRLCNSKTLCVNNLDLSPLTDSYFSNKLLTH